MLAARFYYRRVSSTVLTLFRTQLRKVSVVTTTMPTNRSGQPVYRIKALSGEVGFGADMVELQDEYRRFKRLLTRRPDGENVELKGMVIYIRLDVSAHILNACRLGLPTHRRENTSGAYMETQVWLLGDVVTLYIVERQAMEHEMLFYLQLNENGRTVLWDPRTGLVQPSQPQQDQPADHRGRRTPPPSPQDIGAVISGRVNHAHEVLGKLRGAGRDRLGKLRRRN